MKKNKPIDDELLDAMVHGTAEQVEDLLARGANPNARYGDGATALWDAINHWSLGMIKTLLSAGADVNAHDNGGETALMQAGDNGDDEAIQILLEAGAQIDTQDEGGMSALMHAVRGRRAREAVEALIEHGADYSLVDSEGRTAEDMADDETKPILTMLREDALLKQAVGIGDEKKERRIM